RKCASSSAPKITSGAGCSLCSVLSGPPCCCSANASGGQPPPMAERLLVILPTYNESENLPKIVPRILEQDPRLEILVVDDNSPDGTGRLATDLAGLNPRVHVLHRTQKEGLGRAYLAGFAWGLEREYDRLFEMDADFSHDPRFLVDLIRAVDEGADL